MELDMVYDVYMSDATRAGVNPEQAIADWIGTGLGAFLTDHGLEATIELLSAFREDLKTVMDA